MICKNTLNNILKHQPLIADAAMGTEIFKCVEDGNIKTCCDIANVLCPEIVEKIYDNYIAAGANIITTNTFNSNSLALRHMSVNQNAENLAYKGAKIARKVADKHIKNGKNIIVFGSVPPIFAEEMQAEQAYLQQIKALIEGGVDVVLIETVCSFVAMQVALRAVKQVASCKPIVVSLALKNNCNEFIADVCIEEIVEELDKYNVVAFGINCFENMKNARTIIKKMKQLSHYNIYVSPNAGNPNKKGEYGEMLNENYIQIQQMLESGEIQIIGGCCGTNYKYIAKCKEIIESIKNKCK